MILEDGLENIASTDMDYYWPAKTDPERYEVRALVPASYGIAL